MKATKFEVREWTYELGLEMEAAVERSAGIGPDKWEARAKVALHSAMRQVTTEEAAEFGVANDARVPQRFSTPEEAKTALAAALRALIDKLESA